MKRLGLATIAVALLASCGDSLLSAEIEISELRIALPTQTFPAFDAPSQAWCDPSRTQTDPPCLAASLGYDIGAQIPAFAEEGFTTELRLTELAVALSATGTGPADLGGIKSIVVRAGVAPGVPGSGTVVASYYRANGSAPTTIAITGNANVELSSFLSGGTLPFRIELVVDAGTAAFDANVSATFYTKVGLEWGEYI